MAINIKPFAIPNSLSSSSCHSGMAIGLSRPVPSRPAAGFSSGGTRRDRPARDAVLKLAAQSRPAKCVSLRGPSRGINASMQPKCSSVTGIKMAASISTKSLYGPQDYDRV
ncbi:unnamed protein product [Brassica napus]|uniref:(rape) hypothetical protein n=1 Tax=Brassica napus TaxID=3708 RepID=A0A816S9X0_BRANA|nr:unnamed protein product [Brassica napus]